MEENVKEILKGIKKPKKKLSRKNLLILIVVLAIVTVVIVLYVKKATLSKPEPEIISTSELYKIVDVNKLYTYQCVYNDVCTVKEKDHPEKDAYYVAYTATIQAGIDVKKIKIDTEEPDDQHVSVIVTIPKITLGEPEVDVDSLDYMFVDKSAETGTVFQEAYNACIADVKEKSEEEQTIYNMAAENAKNAIQALVQPFLDAQKGDKEYTLEIVATGEDTNEEEN